jgi:hypothetical protein
MFKIPLFPIKFAIFASLLGALVSRGELVGDANNITQMGVWDLESLATNVPYIMFRIKYAGVDTWNAWQQIQLV